MLLPRPLVRASALRTPLRHRLPLVQRRFFWPPEMGSKEQYEKRYPDPPQLTEKEDPGMNGGWVNPPRVKRQFRDPYENWDDKQERRNFGEPVHEDNDILGMFSPYEYTWTTTGPGLIQMGSFILVVLGLCGIVAYTYPDRVSYPREFEGGLERELGGPGAVRARKPGDPDP